MNLLMDKILIEIWLESKLIYLSSLKGKYEEDKYSQKVYICNIDSSHTILLNEGIIISNINACTIRLFGGYQSHFISIIIYCQ